MNLKRKRVLPILAQVLAASISLYVLVISVGKTEIKSVLEETFNHRNVTARQRVIYSWDKDKVRIYQYSHSTFTGCEYTNCLLTYSSNPDDTKYADVVLVDFRSSQNVDQAKYSTGYGLAVGWPRVPTIPLVQMEGLLQ